MRLGEAKERFLNKKDIWDIDFRDPKFVRDPALLAKYRGSVRLSAGLFYTTDEWQCERERILKQRLP